LPSVPSAIFFLAYAILVLKRCEYPVNFTLLPQRSRQFVRLEQLHGDRLLQRHVLPARRRSRDGCVCPAVQT
jgi:hypothetical protein